jgi:hypothetical protein
MKKMKVTPVEEVNYGLYLWQTADGSLVCDEDGNYLSIPAIRGDIRQIKKIKDAANYYGIPEGKPVFFSGHRQVTDDEYQNQKQRLEWGLVPDIWDTPAIKEDLQQKKKMGLV